MYRDINLSNVVRKRYYDEKDDWTDMPDEMYDAHASRFRSFLLKQCRRNSRIYNIIKNLSFANCKDYSIFERLVYERDINQVSYIAGQDYTEEIKYLKKLLIGE